MKYELAPDLKEKAVEIIRVLGLNHIQIDNIGCLRSWGTSSRAIARCHALGKVMQHALGRKAFYTIEFISERFDKQSEEEKIKTIIHELMHIPKAFGGGFKFHDYVCHKNVEILYKKYIHADTNNLSINADDFVEKKSSFWFR